jgi:hypothetical protein
LSTKYGDYQLEENVKMLYTVSAVIKSESLKGELDNFIKMEEL